MNYNEDFTHSELIYLFIDGEASTEQRNALFAALNNDSDLAEEFQDALKLRDSAFAGVHSATPPQALTDNLFAKAGFATAVAGAATIAASKPSLLSTIGQGVTGFVTKNVAASLLISSLTGALGCLALSNVLSSADAEQAIPVYSAKTVEAPSTAESQSLLNKAANVSQSQSSLAEKVGSEVAPRIIYIREIKDADESVALDNTVKNENIKEPVTSPEEVNTSKVIYVPNTLADASLAKNNPNISIFNSLPEPMISTEEFVPTLLIETDLLKGMSLYPARDFSGNSGYIQNAKLSAMLRVSDNGYAGIEAGNEEFPIYVKSTDGQFRLNNTLFSIGGKYEYYVKQLSLFDRLFPYATGFAGWSKSGVVLKAGAGLVWMPDNRVSLKLGLENMSLIHQYKSQTKHAGKLGLVYGVAVSF